MPVLYIYNKSDLGTAFSPGTPETENVYISALTRAGIDVLVDKLDKLAHMKKKQYTFLLPNYKLGLVNSLYSNATVLSCEYSENGAAVIAVADEKTAGPLKKYILSEG